jgi:hypothetical protein
MGEWNRARDAIHEATTFETRDAAIDALWNMVRRDTVRELEDLISGCREFLEGPDARNTCEWLLALLRHRQDRKDQ